jgi:MFS family permease
VFAGGRADLRRILIAYTVNELGTWFGYIALAVAVYDHTHSAIAVAALFVCARCLPAVVVPALVARVEASKRKGELAALYFVEGATAVALAILVTHFSMPVILLLVAVDGTAMLSASALLRAAAARAGVEESADGGDPDLAVRERGERRANAALNIAFSVTVAVGPAIAGVTVAAASASAALVVDAASFIACGLLLIDVRPNIEQLDAESIRERIAVAWRYVRTVPRLGSLFLTEAVALVFFTATTPLEVLYAKATLHAGDAGFGAIAAVWGVGMVAGGLVFSRATRRPLTLLLTIGTAAVGLAYVGFAAAPNLLVACVAAVIGGAGNGVQWASMISAVQRLAPPALHGQMMGAVEALGSICPAVGFSLGGAIATLTSPRTAYLSAGVAALAVTAAFRRLSRQDPGTAVSAPKPAEVQRSAALDPSPARHGATLGHELLP